MTKWYYNRAGEAEGPHTVEAMAALTAQGQMREGTLVLAPGATQWREIEVLAPSWWLESKPRTLEVPTSKSASTSRTNSNNAAPPPHRVPVPMAPVDEARREPEGGLFKRLFGRKK